MKKILSLFVAALWILSFGAMARIVFRPLSDPDLWWHLASGRYMAEHFTILNREVFSHTLAGHPWINFEWLIQIIYFAIHSWVGMDGFFWFCYALYLLSLGLLFLIVRREMSPGIPALILFWIAFFVLSYRFDSRAELVTLIFLPALCYACMKARDFRPNALKALPVAIFLLIVLWVNLHAGVLYGVGLLFSFVIGARWAKEPAAYVRTIDRSFALGLLALIVNPYGPRYFEMVIEVMANRDVAQRYLGEWTVPAIRMFPAFWLLFAMGGTLLVIGLIKRWRPAYRWAPAFVIFSVWSTSHARATALLAFIAVPFLAELYRFHQEELRRQSFFESAQIAAAALCVFFIARGAAAFSLPMNAKVAWELFPVKACRFIDDAGIRGRVFTTLRYGNHFTWALGPDRKTLMYGSYLFLPYIEQTEELINADEIRLRAWNRFLRENEIDYVLTPYARHRFPGDEERPYPTSLLEHVFPRNDWALVYFDDTTVVLVKRVDKFRRIIEAHEYEIMWPINLQRMSVEAGTRGLDEPRAREELDRHRLAAGQTRVSRRLEDVLGL